MTNESESKQPDHLPFHNKGLSEEEIEFIVKVFNMYAKKE